MGNVTIRNGGTANQVGLTSPANINTPMGDLTAFSLRVGEAMEIVSNGATFKVDGYVPPLLIGSFGFVQVADRVAAAPGAPVAGNRYIVTAAFSTFAQHDIIEASGQGTFFKITPPTDCGWAGLREDGGRLLQLPRFGLGLSIGHADPGGAGHRQHCVHDGIAYLAGHAGARIFRVHSQRGFGHDNSER